MTGHHFTQQTESKGSTAVLLFMFFHINLSSIKRCPQNLHTNLSQLQSLISRTQQINTTLSHIHLQHKPNICFKVQTTHFSVAKNGACQRSSCCHTLRPHTQHCPCTLSTRLPTLLALHNRVSPSLQARPGPRPPFNRRSFKNRIS